MKNSQSRLSRFRRRSNAATSARSGFTLIEIMIAITILAGVVLTMAMNTTSSARNVAKSGTRSRAQAMVDQQIARARGWPTYSTLSQLSGARFNATVNGLSSTTGVDTDTTAGKSITVVMVTISSSNLAVLPLPIKRSISIAAP